MRKVHWLFVFRLTLVVGIFASSVLALDYTSVEPHFCGLESGCGAVRASGFGYLPLFGTFVPLPIPGLLALLGAMGMSLGLSPRLQSRLLIPASYALGAVGLVLLALQAFYIGAFCVYCVLVDVSTLVLAFCSFQLRGLGLDEAVAQDTARSSLVDPSEILSEGSKLSSGWQDDSRLYEAPTPLVRPAPSEPLRLRALAWAGLTVVALLSPQLYPSLVKGPAVPSAVLELYEPGRLNVVEFFDFECPHCRALAPRLKGALARYEGKVHFVRQYIPLPGHERARPAAIAALCAAEQGKEESVAHELLTNEDLSDAGILKGITAAGLDVKKWSDCAASSRPEERLKKDLERLEKADFLGLPTTYIGGTRVLGAQPAAVYAEALEKAASGTDQSGLNPWVYWLVVACLALSCAFFGRVQPKGPDLRA